MVENLDESGEADMIMVSSSEQEKADEAANSENGEEIEIEDDEEATNENDDSNDAPKDNDDSVAAESEVVETVDKKTPKPAQKKTKKKDKGK